jgi:hypothetical protein
MYFFQTKIITSSTKISKSKSLKPKLSKQTPDKIREERKRKAKRKWETKSTSRTLKV